MLSTECQWARQKQGDGKGSYCNNPSDRWWFTTRVRKLEIRNNGQILGIYIFFFSGYILMAEPVEFPSWKEKGIQGFQSEKLEGGCSSTEVGWRGGGDLGGTVFGNEERSGNSVLNVFSLRCLLDPQYKYWVNMWLDTWACSWKGEFWENNIIWDSWVCK